MGVELAQEIAISLLSPHPRNSEIYGEEDISELVEYIRDSKWIQPLVISQHNRIISEHRRWQAARILGYTKVPYVRQTFTTEIDELKALLLENATRDKTPEQKVREGDKWKEIEAEDAIARQALGGGDKYNVEPLSDNCHTPLDKGRTNDKVADRVGFSSGRTYERAAKVVSVADKMKEEGKVEESQALLKVLNGQSVNAATRVLGMSEPKKEAVLQAIASDKANTVKQAEAIIDQELPPSNEEEEEDDDDAIKAIEKEKHDAHTMRVMGSSESPEWYTPHEIIETVLSLMGIIDLDPCSNSHEDPKVPARILYTKEDGGLSRQWTGKVYLNPPYGSEVDTWTSKLIASYKQRDIEEAIALLPGRIDTQWFAPLYDYLICIIRGRVQFENSPYHAPFPCVLVYLGKRGEEFVKIFRNFGPIVQRIG